MARYLIGIDNGSQSTKVTVFDKSGHAVAEGRQALRPYDTPRPGVVEHPDDDLWDSIGAACRSAMSSYFEDFGGSAADLAAVGLCTIRFCRVVLRADGTLAQPVMSWMDDRVARPYETEAADARWVTTSSGYLTGRMTGQLIDTAANYAGLWPIDPQTWQWSADPEDYRRTGIPAEMLVDLIAPGQILGEVTAEAARHTGLPAGLPVVATANDKAVEALGSGLRDRQTLAISLGTYSTGMALGSEWTGQARSFWTNFASMPQTYLYESAGVRRGMWTVSWIRDVLGAAGTESAHAAASGGPSAEEELNRGAEQVPAGSDGLLTVLDWLAPTEAPFRKGSMLGFDARHGPFHLYRSILEGLAFTLRGTTSAMAEELGSTPERLVVSGGGARSDLVMQIFADVFGLPAHRAGTPDAAGLGAAVCAAVGTGVHAGFEEATAAMVRSGTIFEPDGANHLLYSRLGEVHRDVQHHTDPLYRKLQAKTDT